MSDKWTRDQKISALSAATGVIGLAANSIKPLTDLLGPIYPFIQPVAFIAIGTFMGYAFTRSFYAKQLSSKDEEISELKNLRHERSDLFAEFRELTHDEQRQIVSVMLSEPAGITPSDEQREHMGSWVMMKDFVRHDANTDRLHLLNGVKDMLLENPGHVYDLMAARVADLDAKIVELEKRPAQEEVDEAVRRAAAPLLKEIAEKEAVIDKLTTDPSPRERLENLLPGFSRACLRAIVKAYDADGMVKADDESIVMASVQAGQGVFILESMTLYGMTRTTGRYALNDGFRKALNENPDILERIRDDVSA